MVKDTTLYDTMEVTPDATEAQIKKSYNKLSKQWHPDKHNEQNKKDEATQKFQEINKAKEVLLDKEKRQLYDQIGMDMFKMNTPDNQSNFDAFGQFSNMFGGGFPFASGFVPGMGGQQPRSRQPENIVETINVTLNQLYNEEVIDVTYKQKNWCTKCDGEGAKDNKTTTCQSCGGKGVQVQITRMGPMVQQSVGECHQCKGKGKHIEESNKCDTCNAKGYTIKDKTVQIPLKSGLNHGFQMNLEGKGHQFKNVKTDLILIINQTPHKIFKRHMDDLFIELELKLYQALFGFDKVINHMDGRSLHISCSSKTDFNTFRKISGEGMKSIKNDTKGNLYVKFSINLPNFATLPTDSKTQLKLILQSFDKTEVQTENQINTATNLTKTILSDCKHDIAEQLNEILNNIKNTKHKQHRKQDAANSMFQEHMDDEQSGPQCVQQ
jgi:DnaJ family protein A protein 2